MSEAPSINTGGSEPTIGTNFENQPLVELKKIHTGGDSQGKTLIVDPYDKFKPEVNVKLEKPSVTLEEFHRIVAESLNDMRSTSHDAKESEALSQQGARFESLDRLKAISKQIEQLTSYANIFNQIFRLFDNIQASDQLNNQIRFLDQQIEFETGVLRNSIDPTKKASYIDELPAEVMSSSQGGGDASIAQTGAGVSLTVLTPGVNAQAVESTLTKAMLAAGRNVQGDPTAPDIMSHLETLLTGLLTATSLHGAKLGLSRLGNHAIGLTSNSETAKAITTLGFIETIQAELTSGRIDEYIKALVGDLGAANQLITGFKLAAMELTLMKAAEGLGTPGLVAQILGNAITNPALKGLLADHPQSLASILTSNLGNAYSKKAIAEMLMEGGYAPAEAYALSTNVWSEIIKQLQQQSKTNVINTILEAFAKANIEIQLSKKVAHKMALRLENELSSIYLDTAYRNDLVNSNEIANASTQNAILADIIENTLAGHHTYLRDAREKALDEAKKAGISDVEALAGTTSAIAMANEQIIGQLNPLQRLGGGSLSLSELKEEMRSHILNSTKSEVGGSLANETSNAYVTTLLESPLSILNQMSDAIDDIRRSDKHIDDDELASHLDEVSKPNTELYAIINQAVDPGHVLSNTLLDGVSSTAGKINAPGSDITRNTVDIPA